MCLPETYRVERFDELAPLLAGTRCEAACARLANASLPGLPPPERGLRVTPRVVN